MKLVSLESTSLPLKPSLTPLVLNNNQDNQMNPLFQFLLTQMGLPVVSLIIKEWQTAHAGTFPTSEQVIQIFIDDTNKWIAQGNAWLAANPKV